MNQLDFARSQVEYYRRNLNCASSRDRMIVHGWFHHWQAVVRKLSTSIEGKK